MRGRLDNLVHLLLRELPPELDHLELEKRFLMRVFVLLLLEKGSFRLWFACLGATALHCKRVEVSPPPLADEQVRHQSLMRIGFRRHSGKGTLCLLFACLAAAAADCKSVEVAPQRFAEQQVILDLALLVRLLAA